MLYTIGLGILVIGGTGLLFYWLHKGGFGIPALEGTLDDGKLGSECLGGGIVSERYNCQPNIMATEKTIASKRFFCSIFFSLVLG